MADRHGPLRTPAVRFVERVNGGVVSNGAVLASGDALGLDAVALSPDFLESTGATDPATVPGERVGVLAPEGARPGGGVDPGDLLVLFSSDALDTPEVTGHGAAFEMTAGDFLPARRWLDDGGEPSPAWNTGGKLHDKASPLLIGAGTRSPDELFGMAADTGNNPFDTGNNPFDTGNNPFDTGNNPFLVVAPGDVAFYEPPSLTPRRLFDAGRPAPLGGAAFGMGVLSTPNASLAGQSVNPLVDKATPDLWKLDAARGMLRRAGVTDAADVEWLAGPDPVGDVPDGTEFTMLDEETALESFTGVVSGKRGPWWVGLHVARVTTDDHVIAAGVHRAPAGSAGGADAPPGDLLAPAREYAAEAVGRLTVEFGGGGTS